MLRGSKVLVAGGTGFIGASVVRRLLTMECQVRATFHIRPPVAPDEAVEYVKTDLTIMEDCRRAVEDMDYVFMCAGHSVGAGVPEDDALLSITQDVVMTAQLLQAAHASKVKKYLFISSTTGYPPTNHRPVLEHEMFLNDPYPAYYAMGWMKRYGEILCKLYAQQLKQPMSVAVIRPTNAYGPHDDFDFATSHVVPALIRRVVERHHPIEVWGSGEDIRDLIYIDDLVDGIFSVFEGTDSYAAVNIGTGEGHSIKEVLQTIIEVDGYVDAETRFDISKPSTIPIRLVDTALARKQFGFEAKTSLWEGITRTVEWYRR